MSKNYRSGAPQVPPHQHNGKDNLEVSLQNIIGADLVPYGNNQISSIFFGPDYGYASPNKLGPKQFILNNYSGAQSANSTLASLFQGSALKSTVPIPIIIGPAGGIFEGGNGPVGTIVGFQTEDLVTHELWVLYAEGWRSFTADP